MDVTHASAEKQRHAEACRKSRARIKADPSSKRRRSTSTELTAILSKEPHLLTEQEKRIKNNKRRNSSRRPTVPPPILIPPIGLPPSLAPARTDSLTHLPPSPTSFTFIGQVEINTFGSFELEEELEEVVIPASPEAMANSGSNSAIPVRND
jgi:hypothetical protein